MRWFRFAWQSLAVTVVTAGLVWLLGSRESGPASEWFPTGMVLGGAAIMFLALLTIRGARAPTRPVGLGSPAEVPGWNVTRRSQARDADRLPVGLGFSAKLLTGGLVALVIGLILQRLSA
jgi:hypothetical protein